MPGERGPVQQPGTETERKMQAIWGNVLHIEPASIGVDDSFFQLGGSSIAAMKVVAEARKVGLELAVADIFRHPALRELANQSRGGFHDSVENIEPFALLGDGFDVSSFLHDASSNYQLDPDAIRDAYPCTPLQEGLLSLTLKRSGDYIMQGVYQLSPDVAIEVVCRAWEAVSCAMPILRTRFIYDNSLGLVQVVVEEKIHWANAACLDTYLEADRRNAMGLGQPLTRYAFIKDDAGLPKWFVWTVHHALYDGWSMGLMMDALNRAYKGELIERGPQFQTFIKYINDQDGETIRRYWESVLADCESVPYPTLPPTLTQAVADSEVDYQFSQPQRHLENIMTSNLIRAAWALIAGHMTSSEDVTFGVTVSGRSAPVPGIDVMAAPTFATVPVRVRIANAQRVLEYLQGIQQQATDMIPFEQAGLHRIAKICPSAQKACMYQTLLVIQPRETADA